ncbi:Glycosyltransferase involved in cell wall bisynthesis [Nannocystis exedens]|uniref:Glycosyltransferase involved in cell wall bisynthesis n=1 Tax=Nannocystis exedens TaxID=54 RepID=A0A1I2FCW3_9BACT|nr:glycosyltransferase family 2 protein [Nannocystis exedens]PCC70510.1 glycosyl transferase [Nannocystis exedens]SFF03075.1 Glycosyltransferase involved in cell wall bisynthesis [Nannocystis exedens]
MKLIIQIPCLNEREHLPATFADLPRALPGVDSIEVLVIDDGSTDDTAAVAEQIGVHHVLRFPGHRGLAAAFQAGVDACLALGADIIVNTDADNQYPGADIARLCAPILAGRADLVVGDRQTDTIEHFGPLKRLLQRWGSRVVRRASGTTVRDSTSGFRAMNRRAAAALFVHNRFTYTLESIIQAGAAGLTIVDVPITTNPETRRSRLFRSMGSYVRRNGAVIVRSYGMYWPVQTFGVIALLLLAFGLALGGRFTYYYLSRWPEESGHTESLLVGVGAVVLAFLVALMAFLGDLSAANRRLTEQVLAQVRGLSAALAAQQAAPTIAGHRRTAAAPWRPEERA